MTQSNADKAGSVPILGWTSQYFSNSLDADFIMEQAKALVASGMAECGYRYVIIHEGWCAGKDEKGVLMSNKSKFPDMAALVKELNGMGLKAGLYVSAGQIGGAALQSNCSRILLDWGFELVSIGDVQDESAARAICECIRKTKNDVLIDLRTDGFPGAWVAEIANQWNFYDVLDKDFYNVSRHQMDNCREEDNDETKSATRERAKHAGPGHFYNVGIMPIGTGMDFYRDQAIFSDYCILTCPLITGIDLTKMSEATRGILTNKAAIAINQDSLGAPGYCAQYYDPWHCRYIKPLADGTTAFLMLCRCHGGGTATIDSVKDLKLDNQALFEVFDVWEGHSLGTHKGLFSIFVQTSDKGTVPCARLLKVTVQK